MLILLDPIAYDPTPCQAGASADGRWLIASPLPLAAANVAAGVLLADACWPAEPPAILLVCSVMAAAAAAILGSRRSRSWQLATLSLFACTLGMLTFAMQSPTHQIGGQQGVGVVRVVTPTTFDPDDGGRAEVEVESFGPDAAALPADGRRFVWTLKDRNVQVGDRFALRMKLVPPAPTRVPGAPNWQRNYAARGLAGRMIVMGDVVPLPRDDAVLTRGASLLDTHRQAAHAHLQAHSPGGVLSALALGQGRAVEPEVRALYGRCGLAHVLAVSGLHFGLVAVLVFGLASRAVSMSSRLVGRWGAGRLAVLLAVPVLVAYVLYVGAPVSARRAFVMAVCLLAGKVVHREGHPIVALATAAIAILLVNPAELFAPGFQLSFAAVLGLLWTAENYEKPLQTRFEGLTPWLRVPLMWVLSSLVATIGASLTTLPFVLFHFGQIPLIGMVANIWVVPLVSFVLLPLSVLSTLLLSVSPTCADWVAALAGLVESMMTRSVEALDRVVPLIHVDLARDVPVAFLVIYGLAAAAWLLGPSHRWARRIFAPLFAALVAWHLVVAPQPPHQGTLRVTFLYIGQGDATLLEFPDGRTMLIDAGGVPGGDFDTGAMVVLPFLAAVGHRTLDVVVLTHPDFDHMGGLASVIRATRPAEVWTNGDTLPTDAWKDLEAAIDDAGAQHRVMLAGAEPWVAGHVQVRVLWPDVANSPRSRNDNSIVLRVDYGNASFILPGDAEHAAERGMLGAGNALGATVLKSGHHGSRTSSSAAFVDAVGPLHVVHSVGEDNKFGFPHAEVVRDNGRRNVTSWRTDHHGSVRFETDGVSMAIETWNQP